MSEHPTRKQYDVIIIGAGMAGLGAAKYFKQNTNLNFLILEGQAIPGGRIHSTALKNWVPSDGSEPDLIEAGAQWLHNYDNLIYEIARKNSLVYAEESKEGDGTYVRSDGVTVDKQLLEKVSMEMDNIIAECRHLTGSKDKDHPNTVGAFILKKFNKFAESLHCKAEQAMARQIFDWYTRYLIIDNASLTLKEISSNHFGDYNNGEWQAYITFKRGLNRLIQILIALIGEDSVCYDKEVLSIDWKNSSNTVKVKCADASCYEADCLIATCSVGVLKERIETLFQPKLPSPYVKAIQEIGYGTMNKIFMQFETMWWDDAKGIQLVWSAPQYKKTPWTRHISGFDVLNPGSKNTLLGWVGSYGALQMEKLSDKQIIDDCIELLSKFMKRNVPHPIKYYCTRWHSNKFIRGSYSFSSTKSDKTNFTGKMMSQPIRVNTKKEGEMKSILYFAGEACHEKYFSTTHGAFLSGTEQAVQCAAAMTEKLEKLVEKNVSRVRKKTFYS